MNKKEVEVAALGIIRERSALNKEKSAFMLKEARKCEGFVQNEQELRALELEIAKATGAAKSQLEQKKQELIKARKEILEHNGMKESYLDPIYSCKECHDTGYVDGKQCKCLRRIILAKLVEASGIETKSFKSFDEFDESVATDEKQRQKLAQYKKFLLELAEKFPNQKSKCITVCGYTGTGKTFGAKCLAREVLKKQESVLFLTAFEFSALLLKYHTAFISDKNAIIETLLDPELLVIDDLGTEPLLKNVTLEYLYLVLTERVIKNKTTFITTNLDLSQILERYGERIFSRLTDKKQTATILLGGEDLRHKK